MDSPPAPLPRPMSTGEVLDRALKLYRAHFPLLFALFLLLELPAFVLSEMYADDRARLLAGLTSLGSVASLRALLEEAPPVLAVLLLSLFAQQIAVGVGALFTREALQRPSVRPAPLLRHGLRRTPAILFSFVLTSVWMLLLTLLAAVPGALLLWLGAGQPDRLVAMALLVTGGGFTILGVLVVGLGVMLRYGLTTEIVVLEGAGPLTALHRSAELMAGTPGPDFLHNSGLRASFVYAALLCISLSAGTLFSLPTFAASAYYGGDGWFGRMDEVALPQAVSLATGLVELAGQAVLLPFGLLAVGVFYFDLRARRDGADLLSRLALLRSER
ncbi:MAG: hypothetical protein ACK4N5_25440 [Myxococcales bacterium]